MRYIRLINTRMYQRPMLGRVCWGSMLRFLLFRCPATCSELALQLADWPFAALPTSPHKQILTRSSEMCATAGEAAITSAHRINQGSIPDLGKPEGDSDFYFVQADDPETAMPRIIELGLNRFSRLWLSRTLWPIARSRW